MRLRLRGMTASPTISRMAARPSEVILRRHDADGPLQDWRPRPPEGGGMGASAPI
jgi:hypothetical protein